MIYRSFGSYVVTKNPRRDEQEERIIANPIQLIINDYIEADIDLFLGQPLDRLFTHSLMDDEAKAFDSHYVIQYADNIYIYRRNPLNELLYDL